MSEINDKSQQDAPAPKPAICLPSPRSEGRRRGSAVIIVLLLVFLLAATVVSFFLLVQDDRQRSHSFLDVMRSQIMVESATQEVLAKIMDGSEVPYTNASSAYQTYQGVYGYSAQANMTAEPGLMEVRYYNTAPNRGYETNAIAFTSTNAFFQNPFNNQYQTATNQWAPANPWLVPLFSWKWYAPGLRYLRVSGSSVDTTATNANYNPAVQFNINTIQNPFYPGELYLSGLPTPTVSAKAAYDASGNPPTINNFLSTSGTFQFQTGESSMDRPIYVQWIPIYQYPTQAPGPKNKVIGRYCYWVDVENTKVNLNTSRRLFDESAVRSTEGLSQYDANEGTMYDVLASSDPVTSVNPAVPSQYTASPARDIIEAKLWDNYSGTNEVSQDYTTNQGNNNAAISYFNLWYGWNSTETNSEQMLPYAADNSMVDWRVFTGMRPYGPSGSGTNISVEQLTASYGTNIPTQGAFNTWLEAYSMLDPKVQEANTTNGTLTLATMRRTHSMSTTIYGYEDELDPLGRPKIDIAEYQILSPIVNTNYAELWARLNDTNYYNAYYPNAYPNQAGSATNGTGKSFVTSFDGFAGDLSATDANGQAVVNQMLVNIYAYGRSNTESPAYEMNLLTQGNTNGVWPAKSMPYVAEVATRARSAMMLLANLITTNTNGFTTFLTNFFTNVVTTNVNTNGTTNLSTNWYSVTNQSIVGADGKTRPNFWYVTNMLVDMAFSFINPNPFATNTNVTTLTVESDPNGFWNTTGITGALTVPDTANYNPAGLVTGTSHSDTLQGVYALRPSPGGLNGGELGLRASGINCYFNLGAVPSTILTNTNYGTALQVRGWTLSDASNNIYDQAPMPNLGQSPATVRSWWQMALAGNNAGPIYHMTSLAWFRTGSITQPTNASNVIASAFYPNFAPPYVNRSVGWFTPKTVCGLTNYAITAAVTTNVVAGVTNLVTNYATNAYFPGFVFPISTSYIGTNGTNGPYGPDVSTMTNIPDSVFNPPYGFSWYQAIQSQYLNCTNRAIVERVQCVDPVIGHRTGNPANTNTASSATAYTELDSTNGGVTPAPQQVQAATAGSTLYGQFYGVAGHPWRLYDNYMGSTTLTPYAAGSGASTITVTNFITVTNMVPVGVTFNPEPVTYPVVTTEPGPSVPYPAGINTNIVTPLGCLTKPFDNPNNTYFSQAEWDGFNIAQYEGFNWSGGQNGQNGEASVIWSTNNGVQWPADLEMNSVTYAGPAGSPVPPVSGGWWYDGRSGPQGLRGTGNSGSVAYSASFSTPWGIVDSAPKGSPMVSIGELGFVHSGLLQHPIDLGAVQFLKMANYGGASTNILGSPQNGPPMSMLLDLFTPHAFRNNNASVAGTAISTTQTGWLSSTIQNAPSNPRRGTVNVNEGVASDNYLAIREGFANTSNGNPVVNNNSGGAVRANPSSMAVRPAWVPTAMFFRSSLNTVNTGFDESNLQNGMGSGSTIGNGNSENGGRLDAFLQPVPRYRRGWDSVISMIGGDFSDFREMGEGAWLGKVVNPVGNSWAPGINENISTDGGVGYQALGLPLATWRSGLGAYPGWPTPFSEFDTTPTGASELLTLGRSVSINVNTPTPGYFTGHFAADGVSFDTTGNNSITTFLTGTNNDAKGNLWEATRFAITPLRHFLSEIPYDTTGQRDIYVMNSARMPITTDVGNIHTALNGAQNGVAGMMNQMGIFNDAFMEQAANMASTSANAFTIHIVAQAIKNTGKVRTGDVGNSGPGYMNVDDQVLAEQWAQVVVERVPELSGQNVIIPGDVARNSTGAPINDYKILYYRILDNSK